MSATGPLHPPIADMRQMGRHGRFVPGAAVSRCSKQHCYVAGLDEGEDQPPLSSLPQHPNTQPMSPIDSAVTFSRAGL
jgi:hypothetical protein